MKLRPLLFRALAALVFAIFNLQSATAFAQGSAFTYQGRLNLNGAPANGYYDFMFRLLNDPTNGTAAPVIPINPAVAVSNGLFTTGMDFGAENFNGSNRWLEVSVRTNGGGAFTTLAPRQALTPTPYAISANSASNLLGTLPATQLNGTITDAQLSANVALLNANNNFTGTNALNDADLRLRINTDPNHGLGYYNATKNFGGVGPNGPVLFGYSGGALGTTATSNKTELFWNNVGVGIGPNFTAPQDPLHVQSPTDMRIRAETTGPGFAGYLIKNSLANWFLGVDYGTSWVLEENMPQVRIPLVVTTNGNVGIGTNTPAVSLEVNGGIRARGGPPGLFGANNNGFAFNGGGDNDSGMFSTADGDVEFYNNAVEVMRITGGNVGIGTATPLSKLDVRGGAVLTDNVFGFSNIQQGPATGSTYLAAPAGDTLALYTASTERLRVTATGNVGLGTNNPQTSLHVNGPLPQVATFESAADTGTWLNLINDAGGRKWNLITTGSGNGEGPGQLLFRDDTLAAVRMIIQTNGNVGIGTTTPTNRLHVAGGVSATAFVTTSDRNAKENFAPVSPRKVLDKVAALPISTWNYKSMRDGRHIGPTAQDFYAAFGLGGSDTTITTVDPDGVALAAIQGLNQKLEHSLQEKDAEITELKRTVNELTQLMKAINQKLNGGEK